MPPRSGLRFALALAAMVFAASVMPVQKAPALPDVLQAAADYVVRYARQISAIEGEEQYTQHDTSSGRQGGSRRLKSDFVLLGLADGALAAFRDVFEMDGVALRERQGRLVTLLTRQPDASALEQARALSAETVRRYISPNLQVLDDPTFPLEFLRPLNRERFAFTIDGVRTVDGSQIAILRFKEQGPERFIRSPENTPLTGRLWIETATGALRQGDVTFSGKDFNVRASIKYAVEPKLGLWLPLEMVLQSDIRGPGPGGVSNMGAGGNIGMRQTLEGRVLYSRFRQVQIQP